MMVIMKVGRNEFRRQEVVLRNLRQNFRPKQWHPPTTWNGVATNQMNCFSSFPLVLQRLEKMGGHMRSHLAAHSIVTCSFRCYLQHFMLILHGTLKSTNYKIHKYHFFCLQKHNTCPFCVWGMLLSNFATHGSGNILL